MEKNTGVTIARARQSFRAGGSLGFESELLGVELRSPLMLERRVTFDRQ
jgi:DNA-binding GntR family transcriptional regulator